MTAVCCCVPKCCSSVVMQLQIGAVMEHVMKIAETEKFSGIHVKCFNSGILEPVSEVWQLHLTVKNQFPLRDVNTRGFSFLIFFFLSSCSLGEKGPFSSLLIH